MEVIEMAKQALHQIFDPREDQVEVIDERGDGQHFFVRIVSKKFQDKSRIDRSRMVYDSLSGLMKKDHMHAVRMELKTPNEI